MSKGYTYVVSRDYGFAPNPYWKVCTLATCKPIIRKKLNVGDYVFGVSPKAQGNRLIYAMKVTEKMSFNDYWDDLRFQNKKPTMNGTKKTAYGDNIYRYDHEMECWFQADSHHSYAGGRLNETNRKTDTGTTDQLLISEEFFYFGSEMIDIPDEFKSTITRTKNGYPLMQGQKPLTEEECLPFWNWICANKEYGRHGFPIKFSEKFERFPGNP